MDVKPKAIQYKDQSSNTIPVEPSPSKGKTTIVTLPKQDPRRRKLLNLRTTLERDLRAADMTWSLFVAACQSHRYETVLKPFPPAFVGPNDYRNIEGLLRVIEDTPPLSLILNQMHDPDICEVPDNVLDLLHWVIIAMSEPTLQTVDNECFESILSRVPSENPVIQPTFIFQVVSSQTTSAAHRWRILSRDHSTLFAYHGSKLDNFHSILHYGLQQHISKYKADQGRTYSKGIYVSRELSVSLPYSPSGYTWGASKCGSQMSCVALCEFIDNQDYVELQRTSDMLGSYLTAGDSGVSGKYYVMGNKDMVRLRYLLVYCKPDEEVSTRASLYMWMEGHALFLFFLCYAIFLAVLGFLKNL